MYSYFYGKIIDIDEEEVVIDIHDIGYAFKYIHKEDFRPGTLMKVYLYHVVREDEEFLVGFTSKEEKDVFIKLISVKGIGPRTAINALSAITVESFLLAIESGDVKKLKSLPGIGAKAASQIILDLKGKLVRPEQAEILTPEQQDAFDALRALGFKSKEIQEVLKKLPSGLAPEEVIRESLRRLNKS